MWFPQPNYEDFFVSKFIKPCDLEERMKDLRNSLCTIASLNGSFDLLHAGHLHIIYEASKQADLLIVALNSDISIQTYKSELRPILSLEYRLKMISALAFVDYVTAFDEVDPLVILEKIRPDVHVNGSEYGPNCIEADLVRRNGGRLHMVELVPGLSTSALIANIIDKCT